MNESPANLNLYFHTEGLAHKTQLPSLPSVKAEWNLTSKVALLSPTKHEDAKTEE